VTARVTYAGPVPPLTGGIAQHGAQLVAAMRALGVDVTVVSWASQYPPFLHKGQKRDRHARPVAGSRFLLRWYDPISWVRAGRIASQGDLLVFPWVTPFHAVPQRTMEAVAHVPISVMVHNVLPHERMPFEVQLARQVLSHADNAVTHASSMLSDLRAVAPDLDAHAVLMPSALPLSPSPLPPQPPLRLLCLGYVRDYKGFDVAVDAARLLIERGVDVRLTIAGQVWTDREDWRRRVADPALGGRVELDDRYLSDEEIACAVRDHHIIVLPYRSGTQSAAVPIAFAGGRPVVGTAVGGLPEAIEDGGNGRLVQPEDASATANAVQEVAADLARYASAAAATAGSWEEVARALLAPLGPI
jgi:glycosyltransferase involved in cell wall biosynthesis